MHLYPDILTEEVVESPIEAINVPKDKVLRIFPPKIGVRFVVGVNQLKHMPKDEITKQILPQGFRVYADYTEIEKKGFRPLSYICWRVAVECAQRQGGDR